MIDIAVFMQFLRTNFSSEIINVDEFKPDLKFIEIDCLSDPTRKLIIEISVDNIKISTISKEPILDFSLFDFCFYNMKEAESLILNIKKTKDLPRR